MKFLPISFLLLLQACAFSQSIELRAGGNLMPGNYLSVSYEHYSNYVFNLSARIFAEGSRGKGLHYKAFGIDALAEYGSNQDNSVERIFAFRAGLGATVQMESEPWIYNALSRAQKLNYGLVGVLSAEWWMSEHFCLSAFIQQKYLFNPSLGHIHSAFGLGLKLRLQNN